MDLVNQLLAKVTGTLGGGTKGAASSEFRLSLGLVVAATVLFALGRISFDQFGLIAGGLTGSYSLGRGIAKHGNG